MSDMEHMDLIIRTNARGRRRLLALRSAGVLNTLLGRRVESLEAPAPMVQRWREGDNDAGNRLFEYYYDEGQRFFINKVNRGVGQLVKETFERCRTGTEAVGDEDTRVHLLSLANQVLRERFHALRPGPLDFESVTSQQLSPGASLVVAESETHALLCGALRRIPVNDQILMELHYWHHLSMTEISRIVGTGHDRIDDRLTTARNRLDHAMELLRHAPELLGSTMIRLDDQPPPRDLITGHHSLGSLSAG